MGKVHICEKQNDTLMYAQFEASAGRLDIYTKTIFFQDNEIICWDMRYPGAILNKLLRSVNTNQRMYFDIDRYYFKSGSMILYACSLWTRL